MSVSAGFRIKVDLTALNGQRSTTSDACKQYGVVWYFVDTSICDTLGNLKAAVLETFKVDAVAEVIEVTLDECTVTDDTTIMIVNSGDILAFRYSEAGLAKIKAEVDAGACVGEERQDIGKEYQDIGKEYQDIGKERQDIDKEYQYIDKEYQDIGKEYQDIGKEYQDNDKEYQDNDKEYQDNDKEYQDNDKEHQDIEPDNGQEGRIESIDADAQQASTDIDHKEVDHVDVLLTGITEEETRCDSTEPLAKRAKSDDALVQSPPASTPPSKQPQNKKVIKRKKKKPISEWKRKKNRKWYIEKLLRRQEQGKDIVFPPPTSDDEDLFWDILDESEDSNFEADKEEEKGEVEKAADEGGNVTDEKAEGVIAEKEPEGPNNLSKDTMTSNGPVPAKGPKKNKGKKGKKGPKEEVGPIGTNQPKALTKVAQKAANRGLRRGLYAPRSSPRSRRLPPPFLSDAVPLMKIDSTPPFLGRRPRPALLGSSPRTSLLGPFSQMGGRFQQPNAFSGRDYNRDPWASTQNAWYNEDGTHWQSEDNTHWQSEDNTHWQSEDNTHWQSEDNMYYGGDAGPSHSFQQSAPDPFTRDGFHMQNVMSSNACWNPPNVNTFWPGKAARFNNNKNNSFGGRGKKNWKANAKNFRKQVGKVAKHETKKTSSHGQQSQTQKGSSGFQKRRPFLPPDINKFGHLKGPPDVNDIIAYKIIEQSETGNSEVTKFRVGRVMSYDQDMQEVVLECSEPVQISGGDTGNEDEEFTEEVILDVGSFVDARLISSAKKNMLIKNRKEEKQRGRGKL